MANYEATRYDFDGANLTGIEGIPTGTILHGHRQVHQLDF
jgi:hypothetical protein